MTQADNHRWVQTITLTPPSLTDNSADAARLEAALKKGFGLRTVGMHRRQLQSLPEQLRDWEFRATAVVFKETSDQGVLVHLAPPDTTDAFYGLAVDLGTTRVVLRLTSPLDAVKAQVPRRTLSTALVGALPTSGALVVS